MNEFQYGRKIRTSPIYSELEARGAVFGERMGWERALYFNPSHHREDPPSELPAGTWKKPEFIDQIEVKSFFVKNIIIVILFIKFNILISLM